MSRLVSRVDRRSAEFAANDVPRGSGMSFGLKRAPGLVSDNRPHLEPDGGKRPRAVLSVLSVTLEPWRLLLLACPSLTPTPSVRYCRKRRGSRPTSWPVLFKLLLAPILRDKHRFCRPTSWPVLFPLLLPPSQGR